MLKPFCYRNDVSELIWVPFKKTPLLLLASLNFGVRGSLLAPPLSSVFLQMPLCAVLLKHITFCCAMLCISAAYAVVRCLCVRLSGCLSRSCIQSKWVKPIFNFFSPSGSHTILVFPDHTLWQYPDVDPVIKWGQKSWFSTNIWLWHRWMVECRQQFWPRRRPFIAAAITTKRHASVNLVYDSKPRRVNRREQYALVNLKPKAAVEVLYCWS